MILHSIFGGNLIFEKSESHLVECFKKELIFLASVLMHVIDHLDKFDILVFDMIDFLELFLEFLVILLGKFELSVKNKIFLCDFGK